MAEDKQVSCLQALMESTPYVRITEYTLEIYRSKCFRGGGVSPLPTFADARGVGVLGLPTSAIFNNSIYIVGYYQNYFLKSTIV